MKNVCFFVFAAVVAALVPLAGCGSGGSSPVSTVTPLSTPSPRVLSSTIPSTSDTGVTTRAIYDDPPNFPYISVAFQGLAAVGFGTVAEYHIYRNDDIVAELPVTGDDSFLYGAEDRKTTLTYADGGFALPIAYHTIGAKPTELLEADSPGVKAFSADTPIVYRITLLRGTLDRLWQTSYTETEIGRSNSITPFR